MLAFLTIISVKIYGTDSNLHLILILPFTSLVQSRFAISVGKAETDASVTAKTARFSKCMIWRCCYRSSEEKERKREE